MFIHYEYKHTPTMTYIQLYASVKAAFVARYDEPINSLNKWCIANRVHRQNAKKALLNEWKGEGAIALRKRIAEEVGISIDALADVHDENVA